MPSPKKSIAYTIVRKLLDNNHEAYLCGGCVRDMVLNIDSPDYDIATSATPETVQKLFPHTIPVGAHFGVILVIEEGIEFEVATFRADDRYIDGRRPISVRFVSAKEDVERRDFTINGLLFDIVNDKIIDYVNGLKDLSEGLIRTIGNPDDRFQEDKLRLLRAIRFAARFGFTIEKNTLSAIIAKAHLVIEVSMERIRDEIVKMLMHCHSDKAFRLLKDTGMLKAILPEVDALTGVKQPEEFHPEGDVFDHTIKTLTLLDSDSEVIRTETLALSLLLHDIGKPATFYQAKDRIRFNNHNTVGRKMAENTLKRLKFSNQVIEDVSYCVENHMNFMNVENMRQNRLKRFIRQSTFPIELDLHKLDCLASHGDLRIHSFLKDKIKEFGKERISPPLLITGKRLIEMGYSPGPLFKQILTDVEDLQLEDKIATIEDAENYVKSNFPIKTVI